MSIRSSRTSVVEKSKKFPKLMINNKDSIVMFETVRNGCIVFAKDSTLISVISNVWNMDVFNDYLGKITLQNTKN